MAATHVEWRQAGNRNFEIHLAQTCRSLREITGRICTKRLTHDYRYVSLELTEHAVLRRILSKSNLRVPDMFM